ncbi:MAG: flavin reductase family protein [Nocardioides sp.]|uniref:flavin reductase family protein n=1 Tax=Nocardioides sp. TaxID=35761 RepID=UPI0039E5EF6B
MSAHEMITASDTKFDQGLLRQAFGLFPSGVTAFCAMIDGKPEGMAASSFTSVSIDPALVSVCVANTSSTWPRLAALPTLGLSVLAFEHGLVARQLSARGVDRFAEIDWAQTESGAVFVHGASLWLECTPFKTVDAGDHQIVVLEIQSMLLKPDIAPMVFHRSAFHEIAHSA